MWEELENYRPIPGYVCVVRCTCDPNRNARIFCEEDHVMRFLMDLNESYAMVKSQILMMNPFPSLNSTFATLIQYERQNGLGTNNEKEKIMVNAADRKKFNGNFKGKNFVSTKMCTYCGKTRHTMDTCYQKHGFPSNYKFKNSTNHNSGKLSGEPQAVHSVSQIATMNCVAEGTTQATCATEGNISYSICCSVGVPNDEWIIDSGVTYHICTSLKWFDSYEKIHLVSVKLPNGNMTAAQCAGIVKLNDSLILRDVFYIPEFSFNLISISSIIVSLILNVVKHYCLSPVCQDSFGPMLF